MINRRNFLKLTAAAGSVIAGLIPWPKSVRARVANGSPRLMDNFGLQVWKFQDVIASARELDDDCVLQLSPLDRYMHEVSRHPAITEVDFSRHVDFHINSLIVKATGWSEEHQQRFYCGMYIGDEDLLSYEDVFDRLLKIFLDDIDWTLKQGPPKYDYGRPPLIADGEVVWNPS